jgi:hypothetical protein
MAQAHAGIVGEVTHTFEPGYEVTAKFGGQSFHMKDNWITPTRTITIPAREEHEGLLSWTMEVPWVCLHCGAPRGAPSPVLSYDGSLRMTVDGWVNPCGHIEKYSLVREAFTTVEGHAAVDSIMGAPLR